MTVTFTRLDDRGRDRNELVEFLTAHEFPFQAIARPECDVVEGWIDAGRFGDADDASSWIDTDAGRRGQDGSASSSFTTSPTTLRCSICAWPPSLAAEDSAPKC